MIDKCSSCRVGAATRNRPLLIPNGRFHYVTPTLPANGSLAFHVKEKSAGIYVLDGPGKIGEEGVYLR